MNLIEFFQNYPTKVNKINQINALVSVLLDDAYFLDKPLNQVKIELEQHKLPLTDPQLINDINNLNILLKPIKSLYKKDFCSILIGCNSFDEFIDEYNKKLDSARDKIIDKYACSQNNIIMQQLARAGFTPKLYCDELDNLKKYRERCEPVPPQIHLNDYQSQDERIC